MVKIVTDFYLLMIRTVLEVLFAAVFWKIHRGICGLQREAELQNLMFLREWLLGFMTKMTVF